MNARTHVYLPSTTAGKSWRLDAYKPQGRPPVAVAQEGIRAEGSWQVLYGLGGPGGDRSIRRELVGPLTAKKRRAACDALLAELVAAGMVAPDAMPHE